MGKKPDMCERCFGEEDAGIKSARQKNNENWFSDEEDKEALKLNIKYIDLRLGNTCNLKCRMCNPYASSKWVDDWNSVVEQTEFYTGSKLNKKDLDGLKNISWHNSSRVWEDLFPIIETVEEIYLTGGEPFLIAEQIILLSRIIEVGLAEQITLKYNTNLTYLPEGLVDLWSKFKMVKVNVSLDGVEDLNNFIRFGSRWNAILENLERVIKINSVTVGIHITVQMYNILDLHDIYTFFKARYDIDPYLNILNHPACLNIRTLPPLLKAKANERLNSLKEDVEISKIIKYLDKECWNDRCFSDFKTYTKSLDKIRNQNFVSIVKEFEKYF